MSNIATILMDILCHITVEPDEGHDPDDTADLQIDAWQTLIHDLDENEKTIIVQASTAKLNRLRAQKSLNYEQEDIILMLEAFINGEML